MTIPLTLRMTVLERDGFTCRFCGRRAPETQLEIDHVRPRAQGGSDDIDNLVACCMDCNRGKGNRHIEPPKKGENLTLTGQVFFVMRDGGNQRQYVASAGEVLSSPSNGYYLVRYFAGIDGDPLPETRLVHISDMTGWRFYGSREDQLWQLKWGGLTVEGVAPSQWRTPAENRLQ